MDQTRRRSPIDYSLIPNHVRDRLAKVVLECVIDYYKDPEHEAAFQRWLPTYRAEQAAKAAEQAAKAAEEGEA